MNYPIDYINQIICGDSLEVLKQMPDESIDCCITSSPYWGLRAYGTNPQLWDADINCQHEWQEVIDTKRAGSTNADSSYERPSRNASQELRNIKSGFCSKCNAWRGELGLEPTPELYVSHLVQIFREVKRTLKKEGTLFLNLGDTYNGSGGPGTYTDRKKPGVTKFDNPNRDYNGLKPKDLVGIPWRVAFALQSDGWWLRQDIIWAKPNPMPESVKDRNVKSHEYIFLLTKSPKYYYNYMAIREKAVSNKCSPIVSDLQCAKGQQIYRNKRSVWTIPPHPFKGAHFATFPEKLVEPMILAGCPEVGIVLDPFAGSGTTCLVAKKLGRKYIGIDLNPDYVKMAKKRLSQEVLPL